MMEKTVTSIPELVEFLKTQKVGVLAVEMLDGAPHAATVHFAFTAEPFILYFETNSETRKAEPLVKHGKTRASFVVGSNEKSKITLQLDGTVSVVTPEEKAEYDAAYFGSLPEKVKKNSDPKALPLKFTPTWWRFTDWTTPEGKKMWLSH